MKYFFGILLVFSLGIPVSAQFYEFGQDPSSIKWKRIDTEHFRLVYPGDFSEKAQSLAAMMEANYPANTSQLSHQPGKVPLIVHNQTVISNAFVTWAPKRLEFFTFPDPALYPIDWLKELSIHEYRHVVQIDKLNQGFTRFMGFFLGQQANGVVAGMMPLWFIEGDAVSAETSLSQSGRGRLPSFEMELKAKLLSDKKPYSLNKAYLGSYKDMVPDYYRLGFQMVSKAREDYGDDYWTHALDYIAKRPFLLSPYYFYSKRETGGGQSLLYKNTMSTLKDHWSKTADARVVEEISPFNKKARRVYTSYAVPRLLPDASVLALKTSINSIPRFVKIHPGGKEERVFTPGSMVSGRYSYFGDKIIWDEYVQDIRWKNRSYSVLREYDLATGKQRNLSRKSKYVSPAYSSDGKSIVAVEAKPDYSFALVIFDAGDGKLTQTIPSPGNSYLQYPEWIDGTSKIAVIATGEEGKKILLYDLVSDTWKELFKTGFVNIDHLKSKGDYLFFNGGFDGIDQIYSFNMLDGKLRKHSNVLLGAFHPDLSIRNEQFAYSSYGLKGYDIAVRTISSAPWEEFAVPDSISEQLFASVNLKSDTLDFNPTGQLTASYPEKPYNKFSHLIKLHSWAPYWFDYTDPNIDDPQISTGLTLLSQNELSTAFASLGYERAFGENFLHTRFTYKGLFPVFDFTTSYGGSSPVATVSDVPEPERAPGLSSTLSSYVPLTFSSGKVLSGMQPSLQFTYNSTFFYNTEAGAYKQGVGFFVPRLYLYSYLRTSARDLQPRLGFTLDGKLSTAPLHTELYGNIKSLRLNLYLPGIIRNQGLRLRGEWQNQDVASYYFQNHLSLPRGYTQRTFIDISRYSADYAFPIVYPDLSLGSLLYLKRIRGNLYVDYMEGVESYITETRTTRPEHLLSQGVELLADYHLFRFIVEFTSGARISYLPKEKSFGVQMLFTFNIDKF